MSYLVPISLDKEKNCLLLLLRIFCWKEMNLVFCSGSRIFVFCKVAKDSEICTPNALSYYI